MNSFIKLHLKLSSVNYLGKTNLPQHSPTVDVASHKPMALHQESLVVECIAKNDETKHLTAMSL